MSNSVSFFQVPTREENPNGFHRRYNITNADGTAVSPGALFFVLRLDPDARDVCHTAACRKAAEAYERAVRKHPTLSVVGQELLRAVSKTGLLTGYRPANVGHNTFPDFGVYAEFCDDEILPGGWVSASPHGWVGGILQGYAPNSKRPWISDDGTAYLRCRVPITRESSNG